MKKIFIITACAALLAACAKQPDNMQNNSHSNTQSAVCKHAAKGKQPAISLQAQLVINNIMTRTSVRFFTDEPVCEACTETLLRAGMAAPTAVNKQPWCFVVVTDSVMRQRLSDDTGKAPAGRAPLLIVIAVDMERALEGEAQEYWVQDCSAAAENILLAAHGMGLGGVWLGYYPIMSRVEKLREILGMPETVTPLGIMAIGHPAENPEPKDKWKPENVHYEKW